MTRLRGLGSPRLVLSVFLLGASLLQVHADLGDAELLQVLAGRSAVNERPAASAPISRRDGGDASCNDDAAGQATPLSLLQLTSRAKRRPGTAGPQAALVELPVQDAQASSAQETSALPHHDIEQHDPVSLADLSRSQGSGAQSEGQGQGINATAVSLLWLLGVLILALVVYTLSSHYSTRSESDPVAAECQAASPGRTWPNLASGRFAFGRPSSRLSTRTLEAGPSASSVDLAAPELPVVYAPLIMPVAHTRLAIPIDPLMDPEFELDILGLAGTPLLSASLSSASSRRNLRITLHNSPGALASVTPTLQVLGGDGLVVGTLAKGAEDDFILRDKAGRQLLQLTMASQDEAKMVSSFSGRTLERATVVRRPAGRLPAEHYEVIVCPGVDSVLVLACFLGVAVFALPSDKV